MGALQVSSAYLRSEAHRGHHAKLPIDCIWDGAYKIKHQCTSAGIIRDPSAVIDDGPNNGALLGSLPPPPVTVLPILRALQQRLPLLLWLPPALLTMPTESKVCQPPCHSQGAPEPMSCRALPHELLPMPR